MFRDQKRYGRDPEVVVRAAPTTFQSPLKWADPKLVFTCSWSDWFHVAADPWRDEAWDVIRRCPQHVFQILTKRPGRIHRHLPEDWGDGWPNVWLGVSVERAAVLHRVDQLRRIPAALRFISAEPLLGSLVPAGGPRLDLNGIDWVIVGGESGSRKDARPMHPAWAREVRDACLAVSIDDEPFDITRLRPAFHFKQWGSWAPDAHAHDPNGYFVLPDGSAASAFDADRYGIDLHGAVRMGYAGPQPKAGGKLLDDVEWCEIPEHGFGQLTLA